MCYYPAGKKCKLDSYLKWALSHSGHPRLDGGHSATPGRASDIHPLSGCEKNTPTQWGAVVDYVPPPGGTPAVPMLGAITVAHTSRDSPSVTALPPDEGVELADVDYLRNGRSMSRHSASEHASVPSEGGRRAPLTDSVVPEASPFAATAIRIDDTSALHPFSPHKSDAGPVRLMTIAHAFNYRLAVLRDGVKSAVVGRSRKAEGCFLSNSDIPWGQQVAVMFQIVSTMALELPSFLAELEDLRGVSPNVHLQCEPWGHNNHEDVDCECQTSDRTAAYVHDITVNGRGSVHPPDAGVASTCHTRSNGHLCIEPNCERGQPGLVPFVSDRPGAYGRLLLTVYVRWRTGLLVSSDWLRPVTRGGWRAGFLDRGSGSADVS